MSERRDPSDYGYNISRSELEDLVSDMFAGSAHRDRSVDELLIHPDEAKEFCNEFRHAHPAYVDLEDQAILRRLMARRKNPLKGPESDAADPPTAS